MQLGIKCLHASQLRRKRKSIFHQRQRSSDRRMRQFKLCSNSTTHLNVHLPRAWCLRTTSWQMFTGKISGRHVSHLSVESEENPAGLWITSTTNPLAKLCEPQCCEQHWIYLAARITCWHCRAQGSRCTRSDADPLPALAELGQTDETFSCRQVSPWGWKPTASASTGHMRHFISQTEWNTLQLMSWLMGHMRMKFTHKTWRTDAAGEQIGQVNTVMCMTSQDTLQ